MKSVYVKYQAALAKVAQAGNPDASPLRPFTTPEQLARDQKSIDTFAASGKRVVGAARVVSFRPQFVDVKSGSGSAYVCVDVSDSKVLNADGVDVTPKSRVPEQALIIGFAAGPLVESSKSWSGSGVC